MADCLLIRQGTSSIGNHATYLQSKKKGGCSTQFDLWMGAARSAPTAPNGLLYYWGVTQKAAFPELAERGEALMTIAGSTRIVEGLFSVLRRRIPDHVAGAMKPETVAERMLIYTYPDVMRDTVARLQQQGAF
jgi:hypothetical protein